MKTFGFSTSHPSCLTFSSSSISPWRTGDITRDFREKYQFLHKLHIRRNSDVNARIRRPRPNPDYESRAYLFHLEFPELAVAGGSVKKLAEIDCIGVVGACPMGSRIAQFASTNGLDVWLSKWTLMGMHSLEPHRIYLLFCQSFRLQRPNDQGKIQSIQDCLYETK